MNTPRIFLLRLRNLFLKERLDRDLQDELTSHLEMHIADNLRAGMSPEEARREALLRLGGLEQTKESVRDRQLLPWLDSLRHDAIFGYRQLVKNKVTSLAAILSRLGDRGLYFCVSPHRRDPSAPATGFLPRTPVFPWSLRQRFR